MSAPSSPRARALRWLLAGAAILLGPGTALAQHGGHGGHGGGHPHGGPPHGGHWDGGHIHGGGGYRPGPGRWAYRPGHVHGFSRPDFARWSGGHWRQTCWGGRCGWWWFTGGLWYFYAAPVYPYPPVVSSITYAPPVYAPAATPGPASLAPPAGLLPRGAAMQNAMARIRDAGGAAATCGQAVTGGRFVFLVIPPG